MGITSSYLPIPFVLIALAWVAWNMLAALERECALDRRRELSVCPIDAAEFLAERLRRTLRRSLIPPSVAFLATLAFVMYCTVRAFERPRVVYHEIEEPIRFLAMTITSIPLVCGVAMRWVANRVAKNVVAPARGLLVPLLLLGLVMGFVTEVLIWSAWAALADVLGPGCIVLLPEPLVLPITAFFVFLADRIAAFGIRSYREGFEALAVAYCCQDA